MAVMVVGAGIAGLTAAIALQRAGVETIVYERVADVAAVQVGAGLGIAYNATRVLSELDLLDETRTRGCDTERLEFRSAKGKPLLHWMIPAGEVQLGVTRRTLHEILVGALEPGTLIHQKTCTGVEQDEAAAMASFEDGTTAEGALLVGADGLYSTLRAQMHGEAEPRYAGYSVLRALVPTEERDPPLPRGVFRMLWGRGASFGMYHVAPDRTYIFGWMRGPAGEHVPPGGRRQALLDRYRDWSPEVVALIERSEEDTIQQTDIYDRPPQFPWGEGRVTLAGDAAHPMTFNMGQGACQGIEDSAALVEAVTEHGERPDALRAYEEGRRRRAAKFTQSSRRVGRLSVVSSPLVCTIRNGGLRVASVGAKLAARRAQAGKV